jgi:hypothetical protein
MSARPTAKPPFWSLTSKPTAKRLRGTHAQLLDAAEAAAQARAQWTEVQDVSPRG